VIDVFDSSVNALENYTRILSYARSFIHALILIRALMHSFIHPPGALTTRVDALVASTRDPFVLSRSLSPPLVHRPIVTDRVVTDRASTPPIHRSIVRAGRISRRPPCERDGRERRLDASRDGVRSIGSATHLNNLRVDGEHVSRCNS
jgi:hypothetical protein